MKMITSQGYWAKRSGANQTKMHYLSIGRKESREHSSINFAPPLV